MKIRIAHRIDRIQIAKIYNQVSGDVEGITRRPEEITETYVFSLLNMPEHRCIFLVAEDDEGEIVGLAHAQKIELMAYDHILSNYTIIVSPTAQLKGIGRGLFKGFLDYLMENRPDVKRLEMEIKYSTKRIEIFEQMGFVTEATIKKRARALDGSFYDQVFMAWENPNFKG